MKSQIHMLNLLLFGVLGPKNFVLFLKYSSFPAEGIQVLGLVAPPASSYGGLSAQQAMSSPEHQHSLSVQFVFMGDCQKRVSS